MSTTKMFEALREALVATQPEPVSAVGIDLGTTKSCAAIARFDPESKQITCECVEYPEPGVPGAPIAVPSVVAVKNDEVFVGHAARRLIGKKGYTPQRDVFAESKNDIGLRYTYWKAPEGYKSAIQIATVILDRLLSGIDDGYDMPVVVTVPASFHGAQRTATLEAATDLVGEDTVRLLDEPYAAFLDMLFRQPDLASTFLREGANILVFDFGGGTCDVAVFTLASAKGAFLPRLRATSRYHRIGGGDIDRAIVHEHLIPQLLQRYDLGRTAFSWKQKRYDIEPQLLPLAERLKLALCRRILDCRAGGKSEDDAEAVAAGEYEVVVGDQSYWLDSPTLTRTIFEQILRAFLDPEPPPESADEYVQRGSIFSPIRHALFQAKLDVQDIDGVLLAGSSSLIPAVQDALRKHFPDARVFSCGSGEALQGAIARGAALQALALAATGKPLIAPVTSSAVGLQTNQGVLHLVDAGTSIPAACSKPLRLLAPQDSASRPVEIAVEVGDGHRVSGRSMWSLPAPVRAGEPLDLTWKLDENQCLELELVRSDHADTEPFHHRFIAPITHIDQGQIARCRMLEREQSIRDGRVSKRELGDAFIALGRDASTLGENEKALHFISLAIMEQGATQHLMNLRGLYREYCGDREGAEESYRAAGQWDPALFNMALMQSKAEHYAQALESIDKAIELDSSREASVLKGQILEKLGKANDAKLLYVDALSGVIDLKACADYQLYWLLKAARILDRSELIASVQEEQKDRGLKAKIAQRQGLLPDQATGAAAKSKRTANG
ncbi:MAG: Hsp70 family protein [Proteobacteria bacterium]|nr:Hsp70 family protein [Pseudomonadota bacterium]